MAIDLVFSAAPATNGSLVFGDDGTAPPITDSTIAFVASLPALGGVVSLSQGWQVGLSAQLPELSGVIPVVTAIAQHISLEAMLPELSGEIGVRYDSNTERPEVCSAASHWQIATPAASGIASRYQLAPQVLHGVAAHSQDARPAQRALRSHWQSADTQRLASRAHYQDAARLQTGEHRLHWQTALAYDRQTRVRYQEAQRLNARPTRLRYQTAWSDRLADVRDHWQEALLVAAAVASGGQQAALLLSGWTPHWQEAWVPRPGQMPARPVVPPTEPCYLPSGALLFDAEWSADGNLVFICEKHGPGPNPGTVIVPIRRAYIVLNSITLHRVDTGAELYAHGFSMTLDYKSWTWSWTASLHHDAAMHLGRDSQGDPAELAAVVNGVPFRLRLERIGRDRRFNPTRWSVSGKGKASILDAPYAPTLSFGNSAPRTAQQIMADVLTINGVSLGWGLDWGLTDWPVTAGAWALRGSYIDAINDIASAAGGYVQPHPTDAILRILPRYPAAPWSWGSITPDFEIPADAAEVEGVEYVDKPVYNKVFVGGVGAGVFGPYKRAGTAGEALAPMVIHPLITHADAHRQRGLAEISDTGNQEHVSLKLQVLPETGVILPGQFVRYLGDKTVMGIVRSTSIDWSRPVLRQTIGIETHA